MFNSNHYKTRLHFDGSFLNTHNYLTLNSSSKYFCKILYVDKVLWLKYFSWHLISVTDKDYYIIDGIQYKSNNSSLVIQYNISTLTSSNHLIIFTTIYNNNLKLGSISGLFKSCTWLEREISEFTGIVFLGLTDTRRLLLDYFEPKHNWQTHISNDKFFSSRLYDITLSF